MPNPNQRDLIRKLQEVQDKMLAEQQALADQHVEVAVGGGAVKVVMNGHQKVSSIAINPDLLDPAEVDMLVDLLIAGVNEAVDRSQSLASERLGAITGGLGLPPGMGG
jgi:DNA-binding YbaB/EbfC family protein